MMSACAVTSEVGVNALRVLVVEDDVLIRMAMIEFSEGLEHEMLEADRDRIALELLAAHRSIYS